MSDTGNIVNLASLGSALCWSNTAALETTMSTTATACASNANVLNTPVNRGNGLPDAYVRCSQSTPCTADQLVNATAVKLYVLVRAEKKTPGHQDTKKYCLASACTNPTDYFNDGIPFNDGYKRHLFTQTIRLTNVATRRETP